MGMGIMGTAGGGARVQPPSAGASVTAGATPIMVIMMATTIPTTTPGGSALDACASTIGRLGHTWSAT